MKRMNLVTAIVFVICSGVALSESRVNPKFSANPPNVTCPVKNSRLPYTGEELRFAIVIQATESMRAVIEELQEYMPQLIDTFESQNPNYVKQYVIVSYDDTDATVVTMAKSGMQTIGYLQQMRIKKGAVACEKQFNQALIKAFGKRDQYDSDTMPKFSSTYVFTDSPANLSSTHDTLSVIGSLEQSRNKLSIFYLPSTPCQSLESPGVQYIFDLVRFTDTRVYQTSAASSEQFVNVMSNSYMTGRAYSRFERNCKASGAAHIAVDSHTASMTVSVIGNQANVTLMDPTGKRYPLKTVLDDKNIVVKQAVGHCPTDQWHSYNTSMCYMGVERWLNWNDANDYCHQLGGSLVSVLNRKQQILFDNQTHGVDYIIGLNDQVSWWQWSSNSTANGIPILSASYQNWAPGETTSMGLPGKNSSRCVATKHDPTMDSGLGRWYTVNCTTTRMRFVCQRPVLDFEESTLPHQRQLQYPDRLPAGNWTINYGIVPGGSSRSTCQLTVDVQSRVHVDWAFTTDENSTVNDVGLSEPRFRKSNRVIASVTGGGKLTSVEVDWGSSGREVESLRFNERVGCHFSYYSTEFKCKKETFNILFHGIDDNSHRFTRQEYGICIGTPPPN